MASHPSRTPLSADTAPDIEEAQVRGWRDMSPIEKARLITGLCQTAELLSLAGIRHRYPTASPHDWFLRLAILKLGRDLAQRVYPGISELSD
jgi:hypothetical protein